EVTSCSHQFVGWALLALEPPYETQDTGQTNLDWSGFENKPMRAGNWVISWRTGGAVLVAVALGWPTVRADEPIPPIANPPKPPPQSIQQVPTSPSAPAPAPDNWRPRSRAGPQGTTAPPPPAANDTWKPRVRADSAVTPARFQGQVERTDSVPGP